jgi:hypothetical protein
MIKLFTKERRNDGKFEREYVSSSLSFTCA